MTVTKSTAARNAACNAVVDLIDDGTNISYGTLDVLTSDSTVISTLRCSYPAFYNAVDGTATAYQIYDNTAFIDGTASSFGFYDRNRTFVWGGDITGPGGGGTLELNSVSIPADSTVSVTEAKYKVP